LREHYIYTGKIDPNSKDVLTYISEYLFINVDDQLRQLNKQDENQLKNLITTPSVKYRRPYDRAMSYYPHTASFMASVNGNDFLTDPTGNRRFLPFEVTAIDIDTAQKKINLDQVYAQAVHLFNTKYQYWFNDSQIVELHENNQRFQVTSAEEELLLEYYEPVDKSSQVKATHLLTRTMIRTHLENTTKSKLNEKKLSEALVKLGYHKIQRTIGGQIKWVWLVIQKDVSDVMDATKNRDVALPSANGSAYPAVPVQEDIPF
jgi:predicted P-loop ATPase